MTAIFFFFLIIDFLKIHDKAATKFQRKLMYTIEMGRMKHKEREIKRGGIGVEIGNTANDYSVGIMYIKNHEYPFFKSTEFNQ